MILNVRRWAADSPIGHDTQFNSVLFKQFKQPMEVVQFPRQAINAVDHDPINFAGFDLLQHPLQCGPVELFTELPASHSIHGRNWQAHINHRTRLLRACEAWLQEKTHEDRRDLLHV